MSGAPRNRCIHAHSSLYRRTDIILGRDAPLVLAVGQVIKNIGEIGHGNLCQIAVLLKLLGADLVMPEVAEQRAADKGPTVDLHGFARPQIRFVAQFQAHIARDLCKKALPPTTETQTQVFVCFRPLTPPDFTQMPP